MQAAQDDEVRLSSQRGEEEALRSFPPRGRPPCRPAEAAKLTRDSSRVRMRFHSEWRSLVQTAGLLEAQLTENAFFLSRDFIHEAFSRTIQLLGRPLRKRAPKVIKCFCVLCCKILTNTEHLRTVRCCFVTSR